MDSLTSLVAVHALHGQPTYHFSVVLREPASYMFMHIVYKLKRHQTVKVVTVFNVCALM